MSDSNFIFVKINSIRTKILLDSGATRSCISSKFLSKLRVPISPLDDDIPDDVFTANNSSMRILGQVDLQIQINGLIVPHTFIVLPALFHDCIFGTDFLLKSHARLDFHDRFVSFYDNLTALPLLPLQSPTNILRLAHAITIPPCSEALTKVLLHRTYKPQLSIVEPLPTLGGRNIALARTLVHPTRSGSVCRILNPTNAQIFLRAHTAVATIEPVDPNDPANRRLLARTPTKTVFVNSLTSAPNLSHEKRLAELKVLGLPLEKDKLTEAEYKSLIKLLHDNKDLFATSLKDLPGTDIVMHKIDTTTEVPIRQRQFRHPPHLEAEIDKQCKMLLDAGIIQPSDSPFNSPVFLIKKHNGDYRFIMDYRSLNSITVPKFFPLLTLESCLDLVGQEKAMYFSVLDQKSGYYSIKMHPDSHPKTAFSTRSGHYEFRRMAFGLQNAPFTFCEALAKLLHNELQEYALIYLDDLIILSRTFESHLSRLDNIFKKFRGANLRINPHKSRFALSEVIYLGHKFSREASRWTKRRSRSLRPIRSQLTRNNCVVS